MGMGPERGTGTPTTLRSIRVFDGETDLGRVDVSWVGDRFVTVGEALQDRADPARARALPDPAWEGLSLIPGLIDTHVHLLSYAGSAYAPHLTWPLITPLTERVLHGASQAMRALDVGVTTLRDMAGSEAQVSLRHAFDDGVLVGPRIFVSGMVGMTAGHSDLFTPPTVRDREPTADGPDACRSLVRKHARSGVDGIKITTSGGVLSTGDRNEWRNYTRAEIAAIVDEAHALGLPVGAHAHTVNGIQVALEEGVDSLEHATQITPEQARLARDRNVTIAPTLLILERIARGEAHVPEESLVKAQSLYEARADALSAAHREGASFVLGTDSSGSTMPFGHQMEEIQAMVRDIGLTALEAMRAATTRAGRAVSDQGLGTVRVGAPCDFLLVRGRPWETISELTPDRLVAVVSRGRVVRGTLPSSEAAPTRP